MTKITGNHSTPVSTHKADAPAPKAPAAKSEAPKAKPHTSGDGFAHGHGKADVPAQASTSGTRASHIQIRGDDVALHNRLLANVDALDGKYGTALTRTPANLAKMMSVTVFDHRMFDGSALKAFVNKTGDKFFVQELPSPRHGDTKPKNYGPFELKAAFPRHSTGISSAHLKDIRASFASQKDIAWKASMPIGQRFESKLMSSESHPDGFSFTALIPTGAMSPSATQADPNTVKSFWVERDGGIAGLKQFAGPFEIDASKPSKPTHPTSDHISAARKSELKDAFGKLDINWRSGGMPIGNAFASVELLKADPKRPGSSTVTALVPTGPMSPNAHHADPNTVGTFFLTRTGAFPGGQQVAGPFELAAINTLETTGPLSEKRMGDLRSALATHLKKPTWAKQLPLGPRFQEIALMSEKHPDGFSYAAMIPVGIISGPVQTHMQLSPEGVKDGIFFKRTGGIAGLTQYMGPFHVK